MATFMDESAQQVSDHSQAETRLHGASDPVAPPAPLVGTEAPVALDTDSEYELFGLVEKLLYDFENQGHSLFWPDVLCPFSFILMNIH